MRKPFIISFILILFLSCSRNENAMDLTGNIKGLKKGVIYLQKFEDSTLIDIDSSLIDGIPEFNFKEIIAEPEVYYIYLKLKDGSLKDVRIPFFAEAKELTLTTDLKNFAVNANITGSKNQDKIYEHQNLMDRFSDKNLELIEQRFKAEQESNDSLVSEIEKKQRNLISGRYLATVNFSLRNKDMEIAPYLMTYVVPDVNKKYLDTVYHSLTPNVKASKYGVSLGQLIKARDTED